MLLSNIYLLLAIAPVCYNDACVMPKTVTKDLLENGDCLESALLFTSGLRVKNERKQLDVAGILLYSPDDALNVHEVFFALLIEPRRVNDSKAAAACNNV